MAGEDDNEKTEDATPQKREDFRKRGQVAQSKELGTAMILIFSLMALWFMGSFIFEQIIETFNVLMGNHVAMSVRDGGIKASILFSLEKTFLLIFPLGAFLWFVSAASSVMQIGFLHNEEALKFDIKKIDPVAGFKRMFSLKSLFEGGKTMLKVLVVSIVVYLIIRSEIEMIPKLMSLNIQQLMKYIGAVSFKLIGGVGLFMFIVAAIDYMYQRWDLEQKMKMSMQEVKQEHKNREGDPLIRARIRKAQREMAQKRMMSEVPTADVIVTNPTHIAIALKYSGNMVAPTVVAKGADLIAEKIKEIAKESNIPIVENIPLARAMFKTLEIGQIIPKELYAAVAEILSYVFKLKKRGVSG